MQQQSKVAHLIPLINIMFVIIILTCVRHYDSELCLKLCFLRLLCHLVVDFYLHCHVYNDTEGREADNPIIMLSFIFLESLCLHVLAFE